MTPFRRARVAAPPPLLALLAVLAVLATVLATVAALLTGPLAGSAAAAPAVPALPAAAGKPDLGPNVKIFDPSMPTAQIQATVNAVAAQQLNNQFGTQRYALLFEPGTYGSVDQPLTFQVGYYTEVAGLGASPADVTINGTIDVYNQCDATGCTALNNFWRSISNLTINVAGQVQCGPTREFWAVSQAAPMRRVRVTGGETTLMDYCTHPSYASGGFIADSAFPGGQVINGSQQQFLTRNSDLTSWSNGVWNQVFAGDVNAPAQSFPTPPYTTLATTPVSREKPFLYVDGAGRWQVFVPAPRTDSTGTSWGAGAARGRSVPLSQFFVARPGDSITTINAALARGRNLLLTPGVYDVDRPIRVTRADAVVLGLGLPTLTAVGGATVLQTANVIGVDIAGLTVDAGTQNSSVLVRIGAGRGSGNAADPTALQDVFFRIGGPHVGKADVSLQVNVNHVVLDDIWAWRADHGDGVGWTTNTAATGVVVNGDDVTATGLFVEHYQQYEVVWNGERGRTVFFQNEMPYDAPDQAAWQHDGLPGWAAYKVADTVTTHQGWGMGSYIYTNVDPSLHSAHGFEVPVTPGVQLHDLLTISLNKAGTIDHVVNDVGAPVTPDVQGPSTVVSYP